MLSGEDFGYLKDEEQNRLHIIVKKALLLGSVLFSIACFIYITINAYYFAYHDKDSNIKVVKSPPEPIKIMEEENQGVVVKDVDKTIYDNIVGNKNRTQENINNVKIIDQAHTPLSNKLSKAKQTTPEVVPNNPPPKLSSSQVVVSERMDSSKIMVYENDVGEKKVNDASLSATKKDQLQKQNLVETKTAQSKLVEKPGRGLARVQVAALSSKNSAIDHWSRLKKNYPNLLSNLNYFVSEVNIGPKGTLHRLQIGNFRSQVEAEDFCRKFIFQAGKSKADCIIVE